MTGFLAAVITITNLCGAVSVETRGACVVSYVPAGVEEVFFVSETGTGGMPLCWPWFAGLGPSEDSRRHGLARYCEFRLVAERHRSPRDSELELRLVSDAETHRLFPYDFELTLIVRLTDILTVSMTGRNTGGAPFTVTEALHPYFAVADQLRCTVEGAEGAVCRLYDPLARRELVFTQSGADGYYVWRAKKDSHLAPNVSPIAPGDWRRFICVENGTMKRERAYTLKPGEGHTLTRTIACRPMP
jgi:D-hexose-6-phosphate mutarotase